VIETQANILLVDDREENLLALEAILEPLGQELVSVTTSTGALKELLLRDFACILLDVQMPELDGFELASLIKQRERSQHIPIIFVTALSKDQGHVFRGYDVGAVDYIFKPIDPDILRSKVSVFVELWEKNRQLQAQAEQLHEQELAALERASEERYRQLADAMPQIVWMSDVEGNATYFNQHFFEYTGLEPDEEDAEPHWTSVVHPADLPAVTASLQRALASAEPLDGEFRVRAADGTYRWNMARVVPVRDETGAVTFWIGTATDIHDRRVVEDQRSFIIAAGDALSQSLDYRQTLSQVAKLAVGDVADWCAVNAVESDGTISEIAVAHAEPAKAALARELAERYPARNRELFGIEAVIRTGETELVPELTDATIERWAEDELQLELLRQLGMSSYMSVPLTARDRVLGAITFVSSGSGRRYGREDMQLAEELARRAATAIENAELYRRAEERAQAARVLATIGDGVFLVDRLGRIRLWNQAAERITHLGEANVLGRPVAHAIPAWDDLSPRVSVARAGEAARAESIPVEVGGRELWLSISAVGFEDGTVYAFRDLTEERALETMRQDLVATVSHELRTPLAAIYGAALTLRRDDVELEDQLRDKLLEVVADESAKLSDIVNDLLLTSQLDSGRLKVHIERCDPVEIAKLEIEAARAHLPENVDLVLEASGELPAVAADAGQLRQVLSNLIDNAVKYSPDGGTVRVAVEPRDHHVRFAVADNGLGIPQAEQRRIFEKFYRLDPDMTRGIGGTGLGLYICRELVRRVSGRIWVESDGGRGSTFVVEIPQEKVAAEVLAHRRAAHAA
jgi:PAS domain S-box-containing protein